MTTTNRTQEFLVYNESYTTAKIQRLRFSGEVPDPYFFEGSPPSGEPGTYIVIAGEALLLSDESPPGSVPANVI